MEETMKGASKSAACMRRLLIAVPRMDPPRVAVVWPAANDCPNEPCQTHHLQGWVTMRASRRLRLLARVAPRPLALQSQRRRHRRSARADYPRATLGCPLPDFVRREIGVTIDRLRLHHPRR